MIIIDSSSGRKAVSQQQYKHQLVSTYIIQINIKYFNNL